MSLNQSLLQELVFKDGIPVYKDHIKTLKILTLTKQEGVSVMDSYLNLVVTPCGSIHLATLKEMLHKSHERICRFYRTDNPVLLPEKLTWHDVVLWFMIFDLKEYAYNPTHSELSTMKQIYDTCTKHDPSLV